MACGAGAAASQQQWGGGYVCDGLVIAVNASGAVGPYVETLVLRFMSCRACVADLSLFRVLSRYG